MRLRQVLTIRAEPGAVFRWIEEPELAARWQPDVAGYQITRAAPGVVGTEFREVLRDATGSLEMRGRITAHVRGSEMAFDVAGPGIRVRSRYRVTPLPPGTRLSVETDVRLGGWLSLLLEPLARPKLARQLDAELGRLRDLCEAEAGRSAPR